MSGKRGKEKFTTEPEKGRGGAKPERRRGEKTKSKGSDVLTVQGPFVFGGVQPFEGFA